MSHSRSLDDLRRRLAAALTLPLPLQSAREWAHAQQMTDSRRAVEATFNGLSAAPSDDSIQSAVHAFARNKTGSSFKEIKHVCYGLTLPTGPEQPLLIQSSTLFSRLMQQVDGRRKEPRQFRRCYQALLQSYFVYERPIDPDEARTQTQAAGDSGFQELRVYLKDHLSLIARPVGRNPVPGWALMLVNHKNLLTEHPCDQYVGELRQGHTKTLQMVCTSLGISHTSWIWQEVVLAHIRELCGRPDQTFADQMFDALDIADNKTELRPSAAVARRVVSALTVRYSNSHSHPESPRLRDMAVAHIGNPWLKRAAWDAFVGHEPARKMVDGWLKSRLIRDFFELLSHDGRADQRRLDYWLRFESVIDDMWFVLGASAAQNKSAEFLELRKRMEGRRRLLTGSGQGENNAFVIKIGKTLLIEFGITGNACFVCDVDDFAPDLARPHFSIYDLKPRSPAKKYTHMSAWERKFDQAICPRIGFWPEDARKAPLSWPEISARHTNDPASGHSEDTSQLAVALEKCQELGYLIDDRRPLGGALWILSVYGITNSSLSDLLSSVGFRFKPGKGYWLKDS